MAKIIVSPGARADLFAQWHYFAIEVANIDLADRYIQSIEQTFETLKRSPGIGPPYKTSKPKLKKLRSWRVDHFPNYLIFYRPLANDSGVEIVRILHGMRDLQSLL